MKKINYQKLLKLISGTILSILLAQLFSLQFAYAAGIITLLTIQDTKRETIFITCKRLLIFLTMTLLSVLVFPLIGFHLVSFGVILIPYLFLCLLWDMKEAIAPIAVLCTHYISAKDCSPEMIQNELLILLIGAGVGVLLNLFFADNKKIVQRQQRLVEERLKAILKRMAFYIQESDKSQYTADCFAEVDKLLSELKTESKNYINNHFIGKHDYYFSYMNLRVAQCSLLKRIYIDITRIEMVPTQAKQIADFLSVMSEEFHETNNAVTLLFQLDILDSYFDKEPLPNSREEFENRAMLYHILKDLEEFVLLKRDFVKRNLQCE